MKTSPVGNTFSAFGKGIGSKTAKQTDQMMATAGKDTTMYDTIGGDAEDTQTDFGKTIKVNSTQMMKELMSGSDEQFFRNFQGSSISKLKETINEKKRQSVVDTPNETQVDTFNMKLLGNKGSDGASHHRGAGGPMPQKPDNISVSKVKNKMRVMPRDRTHKNLHKDMYDNLNTHLPQPPLGKTIGHGLIKNH